MSSHVDILEQRESLRNPMAQSLLFHVGAVGLFLLIAWVENRGRIMWGDPHAMGGAVGITPVSQIPLASRGGLSNPVANDSQSTVPLPPKPVAVEKPQKRVVEKEAIPLKSRNAKPSRPEPASRQRYRNEQVDRPNQLYSDTGQALSSPMFGGQAGSGGVGIGSGSPFGNRFGYYLDLLRRRVAEKWRTNDVNPRLASAPAVVVSFTISRDGSVRDLRLLQRSGDATLDYSAQRAVYEASPLPPLPAGFERNSAEIEFWFVLRR